jgi:hypothetical protein
MDFNSLGLTNLLLLIILILQLVAIVPVVRR